MFEGVVVDCQQRGGAVFVRLTPQTAVARGTTDAKLVAKITPAAVENLGLKPGAVVYVIVKASANDPRTMEPNDMSGHFAEGVAVSYISGDALKLF